MGTFWLVIFSVLNWLKADALEIYQRMESLTSTIIVQAKPATDSDEDLIASLEKKSQTFERFFEQLYDYGKVVIVCVVLVGLLYLGYRLYLKWRNRGQKDLLPMLNHLLNMGISQEDAFEMIAEAIPRLQQPLLRASMELRNGASLAKCCESHLKFLSKKVRIVMILGDEAGLLKPFLNHHVKNRLKLNIKSIGRSSWYAALIMFVAIFMISLILLFVVPSFEKMFASFGHELPALTRFVVDISNILQDYFPVLVFVFCIAIYFARSTRFIYTFFKKNHYNYAHTMSMATHIMLCNNKPLIEAITVSSEITRNKTIISSTERLIQSLQNGNDPFATIIAELRLPREYRFFLATLLSPEGSRPPDSQLVVDCQEQRLTMDLLRTREKKYYLSIIAASILVGFVVVAMYLPIFQLAESVG